MVRAQGTVNSQTLRRSARRKKTVTPEATSDSGRISRSLTPAWSRGANPSHPDDAGRHTGLEASQPERDGFMPTTQEVAETLVAMRARRSDSENRGHEVGCTNSITVGGPDIQYS